MTTSPTPTPDPEASAGTRAFTRDGYIPAEAQYLVASSLRNLDVYGRDDTRIGAIRALLVTHDDTITDAVVDIGGFLGIGMHSIRVPFADLTVLRKTVGTDLHVRMDASEEQIKAMPHHGE